MRWIIIVYVFLILPIACGWDKLQDAKTDAKEQEVVAKLRTMEVKVYGTSGKYILRFPYYDVDIKINGNLRMSY